MVMQLVVYIVFEQFKLDLCSSPVLKLLDFKKPFVGEPDSSDVAVRAVFMQQ